MRKLKYYREWDNGLTEEVTESPFLTNEAETHTFFSSSGREVSPASQCSDFRL